MGEHIDIATFTNCNRNLINFLTCLRLNKQYCLLLGLLFDILKAKAKPLIELSLGRSSLPPLLRVVAIPSFRGSRLVQMVIKLQDKQ